MNWLVKTALNPRVIILGGTSEVILSNFFPNTRSANKFQTGDYPASI